MLPAAHKAATGKPRHELAHILREHGDQYRRTHSLPPQHLKVMRAIERCRTAQLGGHLDQCDSCGFEHPAYNSCRSRYCPKCQSLTKARWLEKQKRRAPAHWSLGCLKKTPLSQRSTRDLMLLLTAIDISRCPRCKTGTLVFLAKLNPQPLDSS